MIYEYPFNERVRVLLRLENLYTRYTFFLRQETIHDHHVALNTLFDILEVVTRTDLKVDLLKEIERYMRSIKNNGQSASEEDRTPNLRQQLDQACLALVATHGKPGHKLKHNEWLMGVRNRTIIPGGGCTFDIPSYWTWLQKPASQRLADLNGWFESIQPVMNAALLLLKILRADAVAEEVQIKSGHYRQMFQSRKAQLLRVEIQGDIVPEVSANRFMLWIRFTQQDGTLKPKPIQEDITCKLTLC